MANGLRINISETEFKAKPIADQNWVLFTAITKIDQYGCDWASRYYKQNYLKKVTIFGAAMGGGLGFAFMIGKIIKCW